jgi:uncharacterized delta-60 repeat protein
MRAEWRGLAAALIAVALAGCSGGGGSGGAGGGTATAPSAPTGVVATPGSGQVTLSWTAVSGATSYNVYWGTPVTETKASHQHQNPGFISGNSITGLAASTAYYFTVTAVNAAGESAESGPALATTGAGVVAACSAGSGGASGSLDTTFNSVGYVTRINSSGTTGNTDAANAVAVESNCSITAAGASLGSSFVRSLAIWRYLNGGTPDTSLAGTGAVFKTGTAGGLNVNRNDLGQALSLRGGTIVAVGSSNDATPNPNMAAWRYTSAGAPDTTFTSNGYVFKGATLGGTTDRAFGGAVDSAGNVIAAGLSFNAGGAQNMAIWRYTNAGVLDTSFNTTGFNSAAPVGSAQAYGVVVDSVDRPVVTGSSGNSMVLWRFTTGGLLDTAGFAATAGYVTSSNAAGGGGPDQGRAVAIDGSGNIVVVGLSLDLNGAVNMAVWRYTGAGVLDTANFGSGTGIFHMTGTAGGTNDVANAVAIDGSGRIVVVGTSKDALAKDTWQSGASPPPAFWTRHSTAAVTSRGPAQPARLMVMSAMLSRSIQTAGSWRRDSPLT